MNRTLRLLGRSVAVTLVATLLGVLIWKVAHQGSGQKFVAEIRNGDRPAAPKLALPVLSRGDIVLSPRLAVALRRGHVDIANLRGRPTVINFFASYCAPCKEEGPLLAEQAADLAGRVTFLGIAYQDFRSDARRLLKKSHASYPCLYDGPGNTASAWGLTGIPETFVLDSRTRVVAHILGRISKRQLEEAIKAAA